MPCEQWFYIEKQYRIAVHEYCDAVDGLDHARNFDREWKRIDAARTLSDQMRIALLQHQRNHGCLEEALIFEELVLGDQGQPGG